MTPTRRLHALGLAAILFAAVWLAGAVGSSRGQLVFDAGWPLTVWQRSDAVAYRVLVDWRLPRLVAAMLVGLALAVAGLLLQSVTRNPLADPYLLGVSGGAGLSVVLLHSVTGLQAQLHWWSAPLAAFTGSLAAMCAVLLLARGAGGRVSMLGMVLAGVVINALCAALMTFVLARFDPFRLRITSTWLAGGIGYTRWPQLLGVSALVSICYVALRLRAHRLNAFALGESAAGFVGVDVRALTRHSAVIASLLAALGVSLAGLLGYVGLIVPHLVRLLVGRDFRVALPLSALGGAALVLVADTAARLLFAPEELPVGVLTAVVGCPLLLWLLRRQLRGVRGDR